MLDLVKQTLAGSQDQDKFKQHKPLQGFSSITAKQAFGCKKRGVKIFVLFNILLSLFIGMAKSRLLIQSGFLPELTLLFFRQIMLLADKFERLPLIMLMVFFVEQPTVLANL